jgi:hypothetical protein
MTLEELARGPNQGPVPDLRNAIVIGAKKDGLTRGFRLKDQKGDEYVVKFDLKDYPELLSAAEVISTKILYAGGYNVPENYIAYIDAAQLQIAPDIKVDGKPFSTPELNKMLDDVACQPDGRYRVVASKILPGTIKGPFTLVGLRVDDPNDLIPHENRRELRGLRVISSWINHWDFKETNTLDTYVEDNGRRFLRHYLIDLGSTLGGATSDVLNNFRGREYGFDMGNILKQLGTAGVYQAPGEKKVAPFSPATGLFRSEGFEPQHWKPVVNAIPFENMTRADALWGTRIVMSFSELDVRRIVQTGQYTDPHDAERIISVLLERQQKIAQYWLNKTEPLADFDVRGMQDDIELTFRDLARDYNVAAAIPALYTYQVRYGSLSSPKQTTSLPQITLTRKELMALVGNVNTAATVDVRIWSNRKHTADPVEVRLYDVLSPTNVQIAKVVRK